MNSYIDAQCKSMMAMMDTFIHSCEVSATKDDGIVSSEEEKAFRKIRKASKKFKKQIAKVI